MTDTGGVATERATERYEAIDLALRAYRRPQDGGVLRRGLVLASACAALFVVGALSLLLLEEALLEEVERLFASLQTADFGAMLAWQFRISLMVLPFKIGLWVLNAAIEAANLRWYLRGEETVGPTGLRLDADTWRVMLAQLVVWLIVYGMWIGLPALFVGLAITAPPLAVVAGILAVLGMLLNIIAVPYVALRLAPVAALAVADGKVSPTRVWSAMRGRMLQPFLAFVLLFVIYFAVSQVIGVVMQFGVMGPFIGMISAVESGEAFDPGAFFALFWSPAMIVTFAVFGTLGVVLGYALAIGLQAICAGAVRDMQGAEADA